MYVNGYTFSGFVSINIGDKSDISAKLFVRKVYQLRINEQMDNSMTLIIIFKVLNGCNRVHINISNCAQGPAYTRCLNG